MDTSRAVINIYDNSSTYVEETTAQVGYTVVQAPKGPCRPIRINKGGAARIKDIFGVSSKSYPELYEAEIFNKEYDLYISAPYSDAKVPVAYVTGSGIFAGAYPLNYTKEGLEAFVFGEKEADEISTGSDFPTIEKSAGEITTAVDSSFFYINTEIPYDEIYGEDGKVTDIDSFLLRNTSISIGLKLSNEKTSKGFKLFDVDDTSETPTSIGEARKSSQNNLILKINIDKATEIGLNADTTGLELLSVNNITSDEVYALIFPKYPSNRKLHLSFAPFDKITNYDGEKWENRNILKITAYEDGAFRNKGNAIYVLGSLNLNEKDGNGSYIGFTDSNSSYVNQDLFTVLVRKPFTESSRFDKTLEGYGTIELSGGSKSCELVGGDVHEYGWEIAGENEYSDVTVFFDSKNHEGDTSWKTSKFFKLAGDDVYSHELAGYIFNVTLKPEDLIVNERVVPNLEDKKLVLGRNYWNICNIGINDESDDGTRFPVVMTGAKAAMQCRINEAKLGGFAPMWQNSVANGLSIGGQLDMLTVRKLKYKYNKKMLDLLDDLNYNPVVNDRQYGLMVTGQKTCQGGNTTDWSYIGHAAAFYNFLKQVRENVMIPQIGKANNPYYRTLRKDQVDAYLSQRLSGSDRIWAWAECDTSTADGINDVYALKARKFVIKVRVKVDIFSEKVELNFTNEGQEVQISAE